MLQYMRNVRQKCVADQGRDRDRQMERGGVEKLVLSTEKTIESWIKPKQQHAGSKKQVCTQFCFMNADTDQDFQMLINK